MRVGKVELEVIVLFESKKILLLYDCVVNI